MKPLLSLVAILSLVAACGRAPDEPRSAFLPETSVAPYAMEDFECLREAIYYEAGAHSPDGQLAVGHVVLNRAADPRFPNTVCKVVAEGENRGRCQFSYRCDGVGEEFGDPVKLRQATRAARLALEGDAADPTRGAVFFHAASLPPGWFGTLERTVRLGGNVFYRG